MKKALIFIFLVVGIFGMGLLSGKANNSVQNQIKTEFKTLPPLQFKAAIDSQKYTLLDIRTADEYKQGHLAGANQIDYYQTDGFANYLDTLDKKAKYLIYCRSGKRSATAMEIMKSKGFEDVSDLSGGYIAWTSANLPSESN